MSSPDVSIIVINYNTFELTCNCIQSVYDKTRDLTFEIILVDNASSECNADLFLQRYPEIVLLKCNENLGFAKGNNKGIEKAKAEVILLLNSDTILINDAIRLCYKRLLFEENVGVITAKLRYPEGNIQRQCRRFDSISLRLIEMFRIHKLWTAQKKADVLLNGYFDHESIVYPDKIWGTFFMFKKQILLSFPERKLADRFFMYGEDNEWCYQLRIFTNYKILYLPEAEVIHYLGGSGYAKNESAEKVKLFIKHKHIYMSDYYGRIKTRIYFLISSETKYLKDDKPKF
ncbi:MAG: glycosyltransferase family 2 protein [Bacteroidota bacterium]